MLPREDLFLNIEVKCNLDVGPSLYFHKVIETKLLFSLTSINIYKLLEVCVVF